MLGKPACTTVGSSGAASNGFALVTARMRMPPDLWNPKLCPVTPTTHIGI